MIPRNRPQPVAVEPPDPVETEEVTVRDVEFTFPAPTESFQLTLYPEDTITDSGTHTVVTVAKTGVTITILNSTVLYKAERTRTIKREVKQ